MQGSRTQRDYPGVPTWLMNSKAPHTIEDLPTRLREYGFNFESAGDLAEAIGKMSARGMDAARNPGRMYEEQQRRIASNYDDWEAHHSVN